MDFDRPKKSFIQGEKQVIDFLFGTLGAFFGVGLYERYFKGASIAFWGAVEHRVLALALDIFDRKAPEVFANLSEHKDPCFVSTYPNFKVTYAITGCIVQAAKQLGVELKDGQADRLVQRFGELYNPLIGAAKLANKQS